MYSKIATKLNRWGSWREKSVNRRIFSAMMTVGVFTVFAKAASASKDLAMAYQFGAGDALDAFLMAWLVPTFAINLVSGSLNAALIPTYIQVLNQEGADAAQRLFASTMVCNLILMLFVMVALTFAGPYLLPLLASGFSQDKLLLTGALYKVLLPCLVLTGVATTWHAVLNARERFAMSAVAPSVSALLTTILIVLWADRMGIYALAWGAVAGFAAEVVILGWWLRHAGVSLCPRWHGITVPLRQVWAQYAPMLAGAFLMGGTDVVGQSLAATLGSGSNAVLSYGSKLPSLIVGVGTLAVSTAVLPYFSRLVASGDYPALRHTVITYAKLVVCATVPLTLLAVYYSEPLVHALFQRGAFTVENAQRVAWVQSLYLLQIPPYTLGILAVRLISSLQANHILMWSSASNLVISVILNYVLMQWLSVAGIALATSVMYLLSMMFLVYMASRLINQRECVQQTIVMA